VPPCGFYGIEFWSVGWQGLEVQTSIPAAQIPYWLAAVNTGVVPDYGDVPPEVTQKVAEKSGNVAAENILLMKTGVQTKPSPLWAD